MSTITDALKKREKEVGQEEVQDIVPVSLDAPDVTVPKESSVRRIAGLGGILLIIGGVAISAAMFYNEFRGRKAAQEAMAQVAPPGREVEAPQPEEATEGALPQPKPESGPSVTPEALGSEAAGPSVPAVTPSEPVKETPGEAVAELASEPPSTVTEVPDAPAEAPIEAPPDPFAGIALQGIVRFDPASPEALINGKSLRVGESINGIVVVEIGVESVKLRYGGIERVISY